MGKICLLKIPPRVLGKVINELYMFGSKIATENPCVYNLKGRARFSCVF